LPYEKLLIGTLNSEQNLELSKYGKFPPLNPIMPWGISIDGVNLPDIPLKMIQNSNLANVSVITGTNENEGAIFLPLLSAIIPNVWLPLDRQRLLIALQFFFNDSTAKLIIANYNKWMGPETFSDEMGEKILRDMFFVCPARKVAREVSKQHQNAYLYHFSFKSENWIDWWALGDYHSAELEYVFSNPWPPYIHIFDSDDTKMAKTFGDLWNSMSKNKQPNFQNSPYPYWPPYEQNNNYCANLDVPMVISKDYLKARCLFWDQVQSIV